MMTQLVDSTALKRLGYDDEAQMILVQFTSSDWYIYSAVPSHENDQLIAAQDTQRADYGRVSLGSLFHRLIKQPAYKYDFQPDYNEVRYYLKITPELGGQNLIDHMHLQGVSPSELFEYLSQR